MSHGPAASRTLLLDDFRAGLRHFIIRVRSTAGDPLGVGILVLAGLLTVPVWGIGPTANPLLAIVLSPQSRTGLTIFFTGLVLVHLLWSGLVAVTTAGRPSGSASARVMPGPPMPALPMGPRTRVFAEALAGVALVIATRAAILAVGGEPLARLAIWGSQGSGLSQPAALAQNTVAGGLLAFPMVLAWTAAAPLGARGLAKPALVALLVLAGLLGGAFAHRWSGVLLPLALTALVLTRVDSGDPRASCVGEAPVRLHHRTSPGSLRQFRRDAWLGPVRTLWPLAVIALGVPLVLETLYPRRFLLLPLFQILALTALPFFPLGLKLTGPGGLLFGGRFLRSWSPLPVPRERVVRAVYAHGLIAAGLVWLVLCVHVARHGGASKLWGLPLFELPAVFLAAAIVTCEAVGDRRRGLLAVACLAGFQMIVPTAWFLANAALDLSSVGFLHSESFWWAEAFGLGLLGSLPPLVHLRRGAPGPT